MPMNGSVNRWDNFPKELVSLCDGDYWLPASSSKIYATVTDFYPNGLWNDYKRVFGTGKQALNMYLEYDDFEEDDYVEIWVTQ